MLVMENIKMEFKHPKYYKELRKRNTEAVAKLGKSHASLKSDQAISLRAHDGECERAPGPGLKPQATEASSLKPKRQASSKASSIKPTERQASSD